MAFPTGSVQSETSSVSNRTIDSLLLVVKTTAEDTTRVNALIQLCREYGFTGNKMNAVEYGMRGSALAKKIGFIKGQAKCLNCVGTAFRDQGDYKRSLEYYRLAMEQWEKLSKTPTEALIGKNGIAGSLADIGIIYEYEGNYPKALEFQQKSLKTAEETGNKRSVSYALCNIGNIYIQMSDYTKALDYKFKSLKISEDINDKPYISNNLAGIGVIYNQLSDFPRSLEYQLKSLKIREEMGEKQGIGSSLNNIAGVYFKLLDYPKALEYQTKSLKIHEALRDKQGIAKALSNLGIIYRNLPDSSCVRMGITVKEKYLRSLDYQLQSLTIAEELGNKRGMAIVMGNIGIIYMKLNDFPTALNYHFRCLKIREDQNDKYGIAASLANIGQIYLKQKKYQSALEVTGKAVRIAEEIGDLGAANDFHYFLYLIYKEMGNSQKALEHYEQYIILHDSIFKLDNQKEILRKQMKFDYEKKATADSVKNVEEQKVKEAQIHAQQAQIKQEQTQRFALYGGLALVVLFAGFIFNRFRITQKQKKIIEEQKKLVETKNEEILDSIHYAKRIQQALLPTDYVLKKHLSEHFILYKPKDIVSGDFYYLTPCPSHSGEKSVALLALCDCTGHGVPGAFISLLNISFLNETITERKITRPDEILNRVREEVVKALNPEGGVEKGMDGMDCSLILFTETLHATSLQITCAGNPIYIVRKGALTVIKPDRQAVGFSYNPKPFTLQEVELQEGDVIYLITDGFGDQFGGPKEKRFKKDKLKELLLTINDQPMEEQKRNLEKTFEEWKGNLEQTDDVTIIGIRASLHQQLLPAYPVIA